MVRKWVALGLALVAVAGLVIGILGIVTTKHTVTTKHLTVDYDVSKKIYYDHETGEELDGDALLEGWAKAPANLNFTDEWKDIPKQADGKHSTPIWIGFIMFVVFGATAAGIFKSIRYY